MDFAVLGPLEVRDAAGDVPVAGRKERALLALLLARRREVVPADVLVDELWPGGPPPTAPRTLQTHVARLRTALGRDGDGSPLVRRVGPGWVLDLTDGALDSEVFEARAAAASRALRESRFTECANLAHDALSLWRGRPYDGHTDLGPCGEESLRLEATRGIVGEDALEAGLALGLAAELVPRLELALAADPLRERLWALLMVALYRSGRQSAALEAYARARRTLADEIGVDPGPELVRIHRQVLEQTLPLHAPMPVVLGGAPLTSCPFPGLGCYGEDDAEAFVGRERVVARLLQRLAASGVVCLVGSSGSGKSSVLRAGLLPVLRTGALPGSEAWRTALVTPGPHPDATLAATAAVDLLVVDQAEELLTLADPDARAAAVEEVLTRVADGTRVVLGVRSDFWARLVELPGIGPLLAADSLPLPPLSEDELRRVVGEGARRGGLRADDDLVEQVLHDVRDQPGALPLLSTALARTWDRRDGDRLTLAGYEASGGVHGAVAQLAEETYAALTGPEQQAAQRLLVRLVADAGDGRPTRRRVPTRALVDPADAAARAALDAFVAARLLVAGDGVEVAHEVLFQAWPRYAGWIADDATGRHLRERITPAARAWDAEGRRDDDLVRGPLLLAATDWATTHPHSLDPLEREFVDASGAAVERERRAAEERAEREARRARALRWLLVATVLLLVVAAVAGALAWAGSRRANDEARAALAGRLGAQALVEPRLDRALLLARQAVEIQDRPETRGDLLGALARVPNLVRVIDTGHRLFGIAASPRGRIAVTTNQGDVLALQVPAMDQRVVASGAGYPAAGVDLTRGGSVVVAVEQEAAQDSVQIRLRDTADGHVLASLPVPDAWFVHASPAGDHVVSASSAAATSWSLVGGRWVRRALPSGTVAVTNFTADGARFATVSEADGATIRRARDAAALRRIPAARGTNAALSPDGARLVVADPGGTLHVWDAVAGTRVADLSGHTGAVQSLAFSADGRRLLSGADDGSAVLWDPGTGAALQRFLASRGPVMAEFVPGGDLVATAAADGTVALWDADGRNAFGAVGRVPAGEPGSSAVALTPDGATLLVAGAGHLLHVVDAGSLAERRRLRFDSAVRAVAVSPDGHAAVVGTDDAAALLDLRTGRSEPLPRAAGGGSGGVAFSPDGDRVAVADGRTGTVAVVDAGSRAVMHRWSAGDTAGGVAFTDDGAFVVAGGARADGSTAVVWRLTDGVEIRRLPATDDPEVAPLVAATHGAEVAVAGRDGVVRFWDAASGEPVSDGLPTLSGLPLALSSTADGRVVAVAGWDGSLALLDGLSYARLGSPLPSYDQNQASAAVTPDGRTLVVVWADGVTRRWDLDAEQWQERACRATGRTLSAQEWRLYVGDVPYAAAC